MRKLMLLLSVLGFGLVAAPASTALAYPPDAPTVEVDNGTPTPGEDITLRAEGFCPGTTVTFSIGGLVVGSAVADANGTATLATQAPDEPGVYEVVASSDAGGDCTRSATSQITVRSSGPVTGANSQIPLVGGGIAVLTGAALLLIASIRKRQPSRAAA